MMNGRLSVRSQDGKGSTFTFTAEFGLPDALPTKEEEESSGRRCKAGAAADGAAGGLEKRGYRVLVAEDNKVNQFVASKILKSVGVAFKVVENGVQAVEAFERDEHYDVILMVSRALHGWCIAFRWLP